MKSYMNGILEIDKSFRRIFAEELKICPKPVCAECGKELEDGDFVDHYFPMYQDLNICKQCLSDENRPKFKIIKGGTSMK